MITKINEFKSAIPFTSEIINVELLTKFALGIELICNYEYGQTYINPEENKIAVCLGDSNPFDIDQLTDWLLYEIVEYKNVELVSVEIDCEFVPENMTYQFKNGKWQQNDN
mgnify:CR=1 FL=1